MTTTFLGLDPWSDITRYLERSRRPAVLAAIAYVGEGARSVLPLRSGDVLVCNLSDAARLAGATSVAVLSGFAANGVEIRNAQWLHAKVIVCGKVAWIGSNNASARSKRQLDEAAVRTTERDAVGEALGFIELLRNSSSRLDVTDLQKLEGRRPRPSRREFPPASTIERPLELPTSLTSLALWDYEMVDFTEAEQDARVAGMPAAQRLRRRTVGPALVDAQPWRGRAPASGTWFCWLDARWVWAPQFVLDHTNSGGAQLLWTCRLHGVRTKVSRHAFTQTAAEVGIRLPKAASTIRGTDLSVLTDLFRR